MGQAEITALIQSYQHKDPRLYEILSQIAKEIAFIQVQTTTIAESSTVVPDLPTSFIFAFTTRNLILSWEEVTNATLYEVRKGQVWDTGTFITRVSSLSVTLDPLTVGTHHYMLKALNGVANYSTDFLTVEIVIPAIGQVVISPLVIDNNVLLYWTEPTSTWEINYYEVYKDDVFQFSVTAEFANLFEAAAATYVYKIRAVDLAGNLGPYTSTTLEVNTPPDFELQDTRISDFSGTKSNVLLSQSKLYACIEITETYQQHFDNNVWASPQAQVDAGYPLWLEPYPLTGYYEEEIDYGSIFTNVIVNTNWSFEQLSGTTSIAIQFEYKDAAIDPYSAPVAGPAAFIPSFRFLRVRVTFTGSTDLSLLTFFNFQISLDVKREVDSGIQVCLAADSGGTQVTFNKAFKDVKSITATAKDATEPLNVDINFTDVANPTTFKILVYDFAGNRINATCYWKARGII